MGGRAGLYVAGSDGNASVQKCVWDATMLKFVVVCLLFGVLPYGVVLVQIVSE